MNGVPLVWCSECHGPSNVESEGREDVTYLDQVVRSYWVRQLDCGHDDVIDTHA